MKSLVVANWKMNPLSFKEAKALFDATKLAAEKAKNISLIIAPPSIYMRELRAGYRGKKIEFGIQNAHTEKVGAFTGEVSFAQAKDAGLSYAIIGHAERRAMGETNEDTKKKVAAALALGLTPILCVGEKDRGHEGEYLSYVQEQLKVGLAEVKKEKIGKVLIAYEPVWAIGAAQGMSPHDMHGMAIFIRKTMREWYGDKAMNVKILYGGSVDALSARKMLLEGDVNGLLVGRVSTDSTKMKALLVAIQNA